MSADIWTLEHDLCRCCHAEGVFNNIAEERNSDEKENYSDMLKNCFEINVLPVTGTLCKVTYAICKKCITRLKDAFEFMLQVKKCEEKFKDYYNRNSIIAIKKYDELNDQEDGSYYMSDPKEDINSLDSRESVEEIINVKAEDPKDALDSRESEDDIISFNIEEPKGDELPKVVVSTKKDKESKTKSSKARVKVKTKTKEGEKKGDSKRTESEVKKRGGKILIQFRLLSHDFKMDGNTYLCGHCDKRYDKASSLRFHLKTTHYKIPRFFCELCNKEFMTLAPFTVHKLEEHNIDDRFKCNACNSMYNTNIQLNKHIKNFHKLGEIYRCEFCEYESFSFEGMYKHKFKHKTVKDYHCRFCKKSFLRKTTLDLHERIHTGDRRKVCKECGQAFVQKASLNYHMTKYHPEVNF